VGREGGQQTTVEELLAYIEGGVGEESEQGTTKPSKRQKKRQKKVTY